ncbi:MAG: thiolase domain-containing protein [Halobacteriaceae archaeon]
MTGVRVAGVGLTEFGVHPERTTRDLFAEAGMAALDDAAIPREDVESILFGNFMSELSERQGHTGPLMAESLGLSVPATRVESACASSGMAARIAVRQLRAGEADVVVVGGAERMHNISTARATEALAIAADALYEVSAGLTFPSAYALMAERYFQEYGGDHEDLAHIAVKNHANAVGNEYAQFQREISVQEVLEAQPIASPLTLLDSCPITDGAAALVLVSEDYAANTDVSAPVAITGSGQGGDRMALGDRESIANTPAATAAAKEAYDDADRSPEDIDLAEVHDCFTIAEVLAIESLGLFDTGTGIGAASNGVTTPEGSMPVNLSGGLKAKGHPVGATGASQLVEATRLLRGDHHNADTVPDAEVAVTHNAGGTVASSVVHILEVQP